MRGVGREEAAEEEAALGAGDGEEGTSVRAPASRPLGGEREGGSGGGSGADGGEAAGRAAGGEEGGEVLEKPFCSEEWEERDSWLPRGVLLGLLLQPGLPFLGLWPCK